MLGWIILVFTVWVTAWQVIRARDRRIAAAHRLAARRRIRSVAAGRPSKPAGTDSQD